MDKFRKKFLEEASEHIHIIEESLLELEKNPDNPELIEKTFRAMHTLKGGGAMFGLDEISKLTHNLETIYDHIRNDRTILSDDIMSTSYEAVDQLKILLNENDNSDEEVSTKQKELLNKIEQLNNYISNNINLPNGTSGHPENKITGQVFKTYYVYFKPEPNIFDNGTNPLYIIDELVTLGEYIVVPRLNHIPELPDINPGVCYIYWEVFIATASSIEELRNVFMFVADDSELEISEIAETNLINNKEFLKEISGQSQTAEKISIQELSHFKRSYANGHRKNASKEENSLLNQKLKETKISSIRVDSEKIDQFMNLVSELVTTQASLTLFSTKEHFQELNQISENMQKLTRDLRDLAFNIALIPIDHVITRFQRLVRDLSKELNKEVDFITEGTDTELDKNIIESLTDPILHILRNAVDHGIEMSEKRKQLNKPEKGKILFKAYYSGANVHIQIQDDGAGMDAEKIKQKAIDKKIINPKTILSKKEILELAFIPGLSTSRNVTGVSGRGVGMDVVNRKISEIRGTIEIDSDVNVGTTISIKLPLTLSIVDGLLVNVDMEKYLIPLTSIQKIYAIHHKQLENNLHKLVELDEKLMPFFYMREEFGIPGNGLNEEHAVVINYEGKKVALIVDNIIGEYQAVLKSLGKQYKDQEMVCGATILGDGTVALVMDTNNMVNSFVDNNAFAEN
ncbi:MAG: chemotaxis protein CheA [Bacteroidales bacterium]|nr:MAG: chemotaxis protein CheA [Bacteroidales bacterium]